MNSLQKTAGIPFVATSFVPLAIDGIYIGIAVTFLRLTL
jgi:hypothetical protein